MDSNHTTIGTCSLCGGPVRVYSGTWGGTEPPTPMCGWCGAIKRAESYGPVIPMRLAQGSTRDKQSAGYEGTFVTDTGLGP